MVFPLFRNYLVVVPRLRSFGRSRFELIGRFHLNFFVRIGLVGNCHIRFVDRPMGCLAHFDLPWLMSQSLHSQLHLLTLRPLH